MPEAATAKDEDGGTMDCIAIHFADRQGGWVGGKRGVLGGIVLLYYSKQLTVLVLG